MTNIINLSSRKPHFTAIPIPLSQYAQEMVEMREKEQAAKSVRTFAKALEVQGMAEFQTCLDHIVNSVCEFGSYEMMQALDRALSDADDQVSNAMRQWRDRDV